MMLGGFPLWLTSKRHKPVTDVAYPCQHRPCGCMTAAQCWRGDCCCFTLEEKLAWAEANGIEPPQHVRPMVEARRQQSAVAAKPSCCTRVSPATTTMDSPPVVQADCDNSAKSCCSIASPLAESELPACCEAAVASSVHRGHFSFSDRPPPVADTSIHNVASIPKAAGPPHCSGSSKKTPSSHQRSGPRWIVGWFALHCRGKSLTSLLSLEPTLVPDSTAALVHDRPCTAWLRLGSEYAVSLMHAPPIPPPRVI